MQKIKTVMVSKKSKVIMVIAVVTILGLLIGLSWVIQQRPKEMTAVDFYEVGDESTITVVDLEPMQKEDATLDTFVKEHESEPGMHVYYDEETDLHHILLFAENGEQITLYGIREQGKTVSVGWTTNQNTEAPESAATLYLTIDGYEPNTTIQTVHITNPQDDLAFIPVAGESTDEMDTGFDQDEDFLSDQDDAYTDRIDVPTTEFEELTDTQKLAVVNKHGYDSVEAFYDVVGGDLKSYDINIDDKLDQLYQRELGMSLEQINALDNQAFNDLILNSGLTVEQFEEKVNQLLIEAGAF